MATPVANDRRRTRVYKISNPRYNLPPHHLLKTRELTPILQPMKHGM
jgi:hypothetical protein